MENFQSIEIYAKYAIGIIGAIVTFNKLRESFAKIKYKQELKLDLEIYEIIKQNREFEREKLEARIKEKLNSSVDSSGINLFNFIYGFILFIGFGYWTLTLFQQEISFNGWSILTLFISGIGLTIMVEGNNNNTNKKEAFFKLGFYDKENFKIAMICLFVSSILLPVLIWKFGEFSWPQFSVSIFLIISIITIARNIKRIK